MYIWIELKKGYRFFDILPGLIKIMTAEEADKCGRCRNCNWDSKCHPHYQITGKERGWLKLCTLDFKAKYLKDLKKEDIL